MTKKIIDILRDYLTDYRKTDEILEYLKSNGIDINSRKWQDVVLEWNEDYGNHESYLAGNSKGYILTYDKEKIKQSNFQKIKKAVSMIKNAKRDLCELGFKSQLNILDSKCDDIENLVDQVEMLNPDVKYEQQKIGWF